MTILDIYSSSTYIADDRRIGKIDQIQEEKEDIHHGPRNDILPAGPSVDRNCRDGWCCTGDWPERRNSIQPGRDPGGVMFVGKY